MKKMSKLILGLALGCLLLLLGAGIFWIINTVGNTYEEYLEGFNDNSCRDKDGKVIEGVTCYTDTEPYNEREFQTTRILLSLLIAFFIVFIIDMQSKTLK